MPTRSGDIRDLNRKLSEIARRKLDVFLTLPKFTAPAFQKLYARYHPCLGTRQLEKSHGDINTNAEVIGVHTVNFKTNFKFLRLEFFGGDPRPS